MKKVFIRSGIRFDYMMYDKSDKFFRKLVKEHISGQLKVAPEHCSSNVLKYMGKPDISVYDRFREKYFRLCSECGLEQYLVPYLMSSHPGSELKDAIELSLYLKNLGLNPEQVQDFYPTPGTISTVMYYTGIHPMTGKNVYVTTDYREKQLQRALLQYSRPENANLVREALKLAGREELIGNGPECLVRPAFGQDGHTRYVPPKKGNKSSHTTAKGGKNQSRNHQQTKPSVAKEKFYQPVLEAKKPKKSKLERIFGDEAARIRIESARISDKDRKKGNDTKHRGQTPPSQTGANVSKRPTKASVKTGKHR